MVCEPVFPLKNRHIFAWLCFKVITLLYIFYNINLLLVFLLFIYILTYINVCDCVLLFPFWHFRVVWFLLNYKWRRTYKNCYYYVKATICGDVLHQFLIMILPMLQICLLPMIFALLCTQSHICWITFQIKYVAVQLIIVTVTISEVSSHIPVMSSKYNLQKPWCNLYVLKYVSKCDICLTYTIYCTIKWNAMNVLMIFDHS